MSKHAEPIGSDEREALRIAIIDRIKKQNPTYESLLETVASLMMSNAELVEVLEKRGTEASHMKTYFAALSLGTAGADELAEEFAAQVGSKSTLMKRSRELVAHAKKRARASTARSGGEAKSAKLDPVREYAFRLANQGNYRSKRNAVLSIRADVREFARSLNIPLSEDQAEKTIGEWLKEAGYTPSAGKRGTRAGTHGPSTSVSNINTKGE